MAELETLVPSTVVNKKGELHIMIRIICGANSQELEGIAGKTLGEVKSQLADVLNIPSPVQAMLGGQSISDDRILAEGDQVELVKPAGVKG